MCVVIFILHYDLVVVNLILQLRMTSASRIEIPHWMLDKARVAVFFPKAATEDFV